MKQIALDSFEAFPVNATRKKHSSLGIASFVIAMIYVAVMLVWFIVALLEALKGHNEASHNLGVAFVVGAVPNVVGMVLGSIGVFQKNRKRGYAVAGMIINGIPLLILVVVIIMLVLGLL